MQQLAKRKDGKCLSKTYTNGRTKLQWQCHKGHKWNAVPESINSGSWCPVCSGHALTTSEKFSQLSLIAKTKNGKCLSKQYSGAHHTLKWECEHGHQWSAVPSSIKQGSWCPICAKNSSGSTQKGSLEEMQEIAINRGGECLSKTYKNSQTKLEWKCHYGHKWKAVPNSVKHGTWCPRCNFNIGEEICRTFFETVFSCEFPKVRPAFLTFKGQRLELDGYCEKLKLAFEHQGIQHFKAYKYFGGETQFKELIERDAAKRRLCKENSIMLIEVRDLVNIVKFKNIEKYLIDLLKSKKVTFNPKSIPKNLEFKSVFSNSNELKKLELLAKSKGGTLKSKFYLGVNVKLDWACKEGHNWIATPAEIKGTKNRQGTWCPVCAIKVRANRLKSNLIEFQKIAESQNGKCLSTEYVNNQTKLKWECQHGHRWSAVPASVKQGTWCPVCAKKLSGSSQRGNIEEMSQLASERGGKCISKNYINAQTKLEWECEYKHRWFARPSDIKTTKSKKGTWCPVCAKQAV